MPPKRANRATSSKIEYGSLMTNLIKFVLVVLVIAWGYLMFGVFRKSNPHLFTTWVEYDFHEWEDPDYLQHNIHNRL